MNRPRRTAGGLATLVVAVLLLAAACAGDDDSAAETSTTTTTAAPAITRSFPTTMDTPADLPGYHVYRPVDLDATGSPLPVITWANGGCVRFDGVWAPLLERWAAAGFVVIAIAAPPDGVVDRAAMTSAEDQALAIDWAEEQNETDGGDYEGRLDLDRVAAAGNSCGGITTIALAIADPRVATAFVLSGSGSFPGTPEAAATELLSDLTVPVAYVVGGPEDIANPNAGQDFEVLPEGLPAYIARRASGDHPTVSTDPSILGDEVAGIGINWFDLSLNGAEAAMTALLDDPCPECEPDVWTVEAKHLDTLVTPR